MPAPEKPLDLKFQSEIRLTPPNRELRISTFNFPPELDEAIKPLLTQLVERRLLPPWLQSLWVEYRMPDDGQYNCISSSAQPEYRQGQFFVKPGFFDPSYAHRRMEFLIHEALHLWVAQYVERAEAHLKAHVPEGPARHTILEEMTHLLEGMVNDLEVLVR